MSNPVAIAAVSEMKPGRYPEKDGYALYIEVVRQFLSEWDIKPSDIQGLLACPSGMAAGGNADIFVHEQLYEELGIHPLYGDTMNAGGATYGLMIQRAALAIEQGIAESVLCVGAGKFPKVGTGGAESMARMVSHESFEFPYGTFIPAIYAQVATRHMHEYGTTAEQFAEVAVSTREWALKNPQAAMYDTEELSVAKVRESRPIATPFHLYDCSIPLEGGAAVLVTSANLAKKINPQPAYLLGAGEYHSHRSIHQAMDLMNMGCAEAGELAYKQAGLTPSDIQFAEIYDAFTVNPLVFMEGLGLCPKGKGGEAFQSGRTRPGGDLPINTYGGLLSFGHTGDASGMSMIVEGARQIMGIAGERQLERNDIGIVHSYGGMMSEHSTLILGK
ncbi:MAG: thiolase family protein [Porticoccaceae bacterium]|nr:thiolase family protein [Porticoccaceae bacterium]